MTTNTTAPTAPAAAPEEHPWRTEGLFSPHYLLHRLPHPKSAAWPDTAEADTALDFARAQFAQYHDALLTASEEDCESKWIVPLAEALGFGWNARKAIPGIPYLLGSADVWFRQQYANHPPECG